MRFKNGLVRLTLVVLLIAVLPAPAASQETSWQKEIEVWREGHKAELLKPDGWLALVGLE